MRAKDVKKPSSDTAQWERSCWCVRGAKRPRETSEVTAAVRRASGRAGRGIVSEMSVWPLNSLSRNEIVRFTFQKGLVSLGIQF